jgi:hypothetical protein
MIWKKNCPIFSKLAQTTQIMPKYKPYFLKAYFDQNVVNLTKDVTIFGNFLVSKKSQ